MNYWLVIYRVLCITLAVILVVGVIIFFLPKIRQNEERQRKAVALEEEIQVKEDMIKQLRKQSERFKTETGVERVAREELGKVRPGETVFRFTDRKTNEVRRTKPK